MLSRFPFFKSRAAAKRTLPVSLKNLIKLDISDYDLIKNNFNTKFLIPERGCCFVIEGIGLIDGLPDSYVLYVWHKKTVTPFILRLAGVILFRVYCTAKLRWFLILRMMSGKAIFPA